MSRLVQKQFRILGSMMAAILVILCGCASDKYEDNSEQYASVSLLPCQEFFLSPLPSLLTNKESFHQRITIEVSRPNAPRETVSGELTGSGTQLFFLPDPKNMDNKKKRAMGISFIWDVALGSGYIQNDALQSYAPFSLPVHYTYSGVEKDSTVEVKSSDSSTSSYAVSRYTDSSGTIARIETKSGSPMINVTGSKAAIQKVSAELFKAPVGFSRYDTIQAMMKEAVARQIGMGRDGGREAKDLEIFDKMPQHIQPSSPIR